jgi:general transcription factor 3C polypeptide 1
VKKQVPDDKLVHSAAKTVEAAERRGALLFVSPALSDNFLGIYDHRYSASKLSAKQKETLERVGASRCALLYHLSKIVITSYTLSVLL